MVYTSQYYLFLIIFGVPFSLLFIAMGAFIVVKTDWLIRTSLKLSKKIGIIKGMPIKKSKKLNKLIGYFWIVLGLILLFCSIKAILL
jgi:hypothetical protein